MSMEGCAIGKVLRSLPILVFLSLFSALYSLDSPSVIPEPAPGVYASPVLVSFKVPADKRLLVSVDGKPFSESVSGILLSAAPGEEKECVVETRLLPLLPGSAAISEQLFVWRIDRKAPLAPSVSSKKTDGGHELAFTLSEPGSIHYQLWHPYYKSRSEGTVPSGGHVFLPEGASLCAVGIDLAGNRSPAVSPGAVLENSDTIPFRVLSPAPGIWSNRQVLLVESAPGSEIRYSLDGSDPSSSGKVYEGPVLLDSSGITEVRVVGIDDSGKQYTDRVMYTVKDSGSSGPAGFPREISLVNTGEFSEIAIPAGFTYSIGDSFPGTQGGKSVLFTAVRGVTRYYMLVLSDGTNDWRFVCASGSDVTKTTTAAVPVSVQKEDAAGGSPAAAVPVAADSQTTVLADAAVPTDGSGTQSVNSATPPQSPEVRILDWYFISFDYSSPIYYSLDGKRWYLYTEPCFVDRSSDTELCWYSDTWKNGEVQKVSLPAKPVISCILYGATTADPVFLAVSAGKYSFRYQVASFFPPSRPDEKSPLLSSGLLVEIPSGAEAPFCVRILAEHDGLADGELYTTFDLDRKPPRTPTTGIDPSLVWSRNPVVFSPSGEDMIQLSIEPDLFSRRGNSYVLDGLPSKPVEYTVSAFAVDRAGNKSSVSTQKVTVDLNSIFVDGSSTGSASGDGSPSSPFKSLDDALDAIHGDGTWRITVRGSVHFEKLHTMQSSIIIDGSGAEIIAGNDACISVSGGSLAISGCTVRQQCDSGSNATILVNQNRPRVLFDIRNGAFTAASMKIDRTGGEDGCILRASCSDISCTGSQFSLDAADYVLLMDVTKSSVKIDTCKLYSKARNASVLSLTGSSAAVTGSTLSVSPSVAGRAIEAWDSRITIGNLILERPASTEGRDTAFWLDAQSLILDERDIIVNGFWRYKETGAR